MCKISRLPPVAHPALRVKRAALGVKGVTDFMSDDGADCTIVSRSRSLRIKKWRLENGRREVQCILQWEIHGIDCLRRHRPFVAVNWSAQARYFAMIFEKIATPDIAENVIWPNFVG